MLSAVLRTIFGVMLTVANAMIIDKWAIKTCTGNIDNYNVCQTSPDKLMYWFSPSDSKCYGIRARQCSFGEEQSADLFEDRSRCETRCIPADFIPCPMGSDPIGSCGQGRNCPPDGYCIMGEYGVCCNATLLEMASVDYKPECPDGAKKYTVPWGGGIPSNKVLLGLKCVHNFCPNGYECVNGFRLSYCCERQCPKDLLDYCDRYIPFCTYRSPWLMRHCAGTCSRELRQCNVAQVGMKGCGEAGKAPGSYAKNAFHAALTDFALDIYRETVTIQGDDKNIFMSPISIAIALGMLTEGAAGKTKRQLVELFDAGGSGSLNAGQLKLLFHDYQSTALASNANYELSNANKIYVDNTYQPLPDFENSLSTCFESAAERLNIGGRPEAARKRINSWVEHKTKSRIKTLIPVGGLDAFTVMVLVNAIYFKADWHAQFNESATQQAPFVKYGAPAGNVQMMHGVFMKDEVGVYSDQYIQAIRLPYKNKQLYMLVLLPNDNMRSAMYRLERRLTADHIKGMRFSSQLRSRDSGRPGVPRPPLGDRDRMIEVYMPKFKLDLSIPLKKILKRLGLEHMFTNFADFSRMSDEKVKVSKAFHKAFVQVNEQGTEASAATAIVMSTRSGIDIPKFRADHPFMFAIVHEASGTPLFVGKYTGP